MLRCARLTDHAPTVEGILPESLSFVPRDLGKHFWQARGAVGLYQSIGDTIVQLFISKASVLMTRVKRFNRSAYDQEHEENET